MRVLLVLLLALGLASCDAPSETRSTAAVFVGNRGVDAGTITRIDPAAGTATQDAVPGLDGLVQSLVVRGDRLYVLLGASAPSGRIDVVDLRTGEWTQRVEVDTPRRLAIVNGVGYVSNGGRSSVTPVTFATGQKGVPIQVGDQPEGVVAVGNRVFVATWNGGTGRDVRVISTLNNVVVQTVDVGCDGPRALLADGDGEVWAFCTGSDASQTNGEAVVLDGASGAVVARIPLDAPLGTSGYGQDAAFSARHDEAYAVVGSGLVRFDTRTNTLAGRVEIGGAAVAAVAYDDATDRLYLGRLAASGPFSADGAVTVHDRSGAEVARYAAGVVPGAITFRPE